MEAFNTVPSFILFAWQGCNAPSLLGGGVFGVQDTAQVVRDVTVPLILLLIAAGAMLLAMLLWWREVAKGLPLTLIAIALACVIGFLGYHANDVYQSMPNLDSLVSGGNYFLAVGEFSFYLLGVMAFLFVSLIVVWREVGWDIERNLLLLSTCATVVMTGFWVMFSMAVWNCV